MARQPAKLKADPEFQRLGVFFDYTLPKWEYAAANFCSPLSRGGQCADRWF